MTIRKLMSAFLVLVIVITAFFGYAVLSSNAATSEFVVYYRRYQTAAHPKRDIYDSTGWPEKAVINPSASISLLATRYTDGDVITIRENPWTLTNHRFVEYVIKNSSGQVVERLQPGDSLALSSSLVNGRDTNSGVDRIDITAVWAQAETYQVIYHANGAEGTVADGAKYSEGTSFTLQAPVTLTYSEHIFVEWNTKADGTGEGYQPGDQCVMGTGEAVFYAIWQKRELDVSTFNLIYDSNGTGEDPISEEHYIGDDLSVDMCWFWHDTAEFGGWNTKPDGSGVTYEELDTIESVPESYLNYDEDGDGEKDAFVLYAMWLCKIAYDPNGGDGDYFEEEVVINSTYRVRDVNLSNEFPYLFGEGDGDFDDEGLIGFSNTVDFLGWNTEPDGSGTAYEPGEYVVVRGGGTLYAIWDDGTYDEYYDDYEYDFMDSDVENFDTGDTSNAFGAIAIALVAAAGFVAFTRKK